jgi:hypothetical protein
MREPRLSTASSMRRMSFEQGKYHRIHVCFKRERHLPRFRGPLFILPRGVSPFLIHFPHTPLRPLPILTSCLPVCTSLSAVSQKIQHSIYICLTSTWARLLREIHKLTIFFSSATLEPSLLPLQWQERSRRRHRETPR